MTHANSRCEHPDRWFRGYLFDLDGTIYLGDHLLPTVANTLARIRANGSRMLFLSNNPTRTVDQYVAKLHGLGISVTPDDILTSLATTTWWLTRHHPTATVFPVGEEPLVAALADAGIRISAQPEEIDFVIASYDRGFSYHKLQVAFDAIHVHRRARLVATNPDRYCPFPNGRGEPDAAAIIGAIEGCTGVACEEVFGKPERIMLDAAVARLGMPVAGCIMVGDRLMTDIAMAHRGGMASALVLTGDSTRADLSALAPDGPHPAYVLDELAHLLPE